MDCAQMRQIVLGGGDLASPEAQRHLEECPACRELAVDGGALARFLAATPPSREEVPTLSFQDLEQQMVGETGFRGRLRSLPSTTRWMLVCASLLAPVAIGLAKLRPDIAIYPSARLGFEICAFGGLALASCWFWLRPLYRAQPNNGVFLAVLAAGLLAPWVIAMFSAVNPESGNALGRPAICFALGSAFAFPVIAVVGGLGRGGRGISGFAILPALAGALAGLVGLELHCPNSAPIHLLTGHAPIALVLPLLWQRLSIRSRRFLPAGEKASR
jgi:hypothetical protein